ncbi:uncharacterized protein PFL1_01832 [Pseudozyma flocculosa PF-1]|uniref:Delta 8-(E)-sphingolipid desaturase n=1 Tax=Pseudozyma flocculosa TaxID=84751 RepID=A0A5C3EWS8_9BASI|nr:uncharacterized protein PFL1_01832 [Pseudozyma flocculosa PF-1]EPQ30934.1 hypothetical protein PFL1_01832 [Pseudozyma flocculosa PF-1]SPO36678.1 related to delta-6 fatty acid desaturase [Pseudozyma flocculosa]
MTATSATTTATATTAAPLSAAATEKSHSRTPRTLTRAQLAQRIANGETLVLHRRKIYKLDSWLERHPGGELAILHFVGRDASDEIEAYHSQHTLDKLMSRFVIGYLDHDEWNSYRPLVPPVQLGYRKGKLDHPHAQITMWHGKESRDPDSDEVEVMLGARTRGGHQQPAKQPVASASAPQPRHISRPQTFPLPVEILEPPPDPPSIDAARERAISAAYKEMHQQVKAAGLYDLRPSGYARECLRYAALGAAAWWFLGRGHAQLAVERAAQQTGQAAATTLLGMSASTVSYLLSSVFLGLFWHQLTFTAHDSGHSGITHSHTVDRLIGTVIADFIGGLSIGWWCNNHDVHHLVTNHPEHDPDIQHMPFFAISPQFVLAGQTAYVTDGDGDGKAARVGAPAEPATTRPLGLWSSYYRRVLEFDAAARFFLRFQHQLYYVVMSLGRFNLYANSYGYLALHARRDGWMLLEVSGILAFWTWYGALVVGSLPTWGHVAAYVVVSHVVTSPLHVQIVLSHFAQSSADLGLSESFASRQIRTTMDVSCPPWLDFVHGGLHMQVSHHLFPRVPRHNLRRLRDQFVRPFCRDHGLRYEEYAFVEGNGRVLDTLRCVAGQVEVLAKVARAQAKGELHH